MRIPVRAISPGILKLTTTLSGVCETVVVGISQNAFFRTKYHRSCLRHPLISVNHCSLRQCFSAQNVAFDNQPPSWLFVSDAVGGEYAAQVNLELELDERLSGVSLEKLKSDLKLRETYFDIDDLVKDFREFRVLEQRRQDMRAEKLRILAEIKLLKETKPSDDVQMSVQKLYKTLLDMKENNEPFWDLEQKVMLAALKLPNDLHNSTPALEDLVVREVRGSIDPPSTQSHVEIAKKFDLVKFSNVGPKAYYLKNELVLAEMALMRTACTYLESRKYRHMAGPEFFKTPIMEGCGLDIHNSDEVLTMLNISKNVVEPMNHLAGVSLPTYAGFVGKTCVGDNILPFNMFACGRCYHNGDHPGLFGAVQSTQATLFSCVKKDDLDNQFTETVDVVWKFLEPLGLPLRLIQVCAKNLRREERRRFEVHMFAPSRQQFIRVAHVSDLSDFVSRRLMVMHNKNHADIRTASLTYMVSGSLLNITSLLAIWMEYSNTNQEEFSLCSLQSVEKP